MNCLILKGSNNLKKVMLFTILLIAGSSVFSQVSNDSVAGLRKFGFGLHVEQILFSDTQLPEVIYPSTKIVLTYNVNNKIRLEPKLGYIRAKDKNHNQDSIGFHLELGFFLMTQREKINIYYGLSTGYNLLLDEDDYWYSGDDNIRNITNRLFIGPKAGGEYFIGKHFSLSGEVGFSFFSDTFKRDGGNRYYDPSDTEKSSYSMVTSGVIMRFYF